MIIDFLFIFYIKHFYLLVYLYVLNILYQFRGNGRCQIFLLKKSWKNFSKFFEKNFQKKNFKKFRKISGKQTNSKFLNFFWRYYQLQCLSYFLNFFSSNLDEIWLLCNNLKKVYGLLLHPLFKNAIKTAFPK